MNITQGQEATLVNSVPFLPKFLKWTYTRKVGTVLTYFLARTDWGFSLHTSTSLEAKNRKKGHLINHPPNHTHTQPNKTHTNRWWDALFSLQIPLSLTSIMSKNALNCAEHLENKIEQQIFSRNHSSRLCKAPKKLLFSIWSAIKRSEVVFSSKVWVGYLCYIFSYFWLLSFKMSSCRASSVALAPDRSNDSVWLHALVVSRKRNRIICTYRTNESR